MTTPPCPAFPGSEAHARSMIVYLTACLEGKTVQRQYVDTRRWRDVGLSDIASAQQYDHFRIKPPLTADEARAEAYWEERQQLAGEIYRVQHQVQQGCVKSGCRFSIDGSTQPKTDCECSNLPEKLRRLADKVAEMNVRVDTVVLPRNGTHPDTTEATS